MQQSLVKKFFDQIAITYSARYDNQQPYHAYLFQERLAKATKALSLDGKKILDIGAGTGPLYDYLKASGKHFIYHACDISEQMLQQSNIPKKNYEACSFEESSYSRQQYDYIFALGLTSYLTPNTLQLYLNLTGSCLCSGGKAIISFTNKKGMEWHFYKAFRPIAKWFGLNDKLIGQVFSTHAYHPTEINDRLPQNLRTKEIRWLSPSIPVLSRMLPSIGIPLAKKLAGTMTYTDFIAIIERIDE